MDDSCVTDDCEHLAIISHMRVLLSALSFGAVVLVH